MPSSKESSVDIEDYELPDAPETSSNFLEVPLSKVEATSEPDIQGLHLKRDEEEDDDDENSPAKLEDIFTDDEEDFLGDADDADFPISETPVKSEPESTAADTPVFKPTLRASDPEVMIAFYQRLFPFRTLFQWLNHSPVPNNDFGHREFAFTLQNDVYLRYQAFPTADSMRKEVLRQNPSRFEIGPVYSANPRDRKVLRKSAFRPLTKELVFDIDLTDYDEVRTCCDKANICIKCWQFITVAIKIVDAALRDDLGFKHIMWVYSGRRGAHAWVCDRKARELDDMKRRAVISYLEVIKGGNQAGKKVNVWRPLHPHLARSLGILRDPFKKDILRNQDPWRETERAEHLLSLLPDKELNDALRKKWDSHDNRPSTSKWEDIDTLAGAGVSSTIDPKKLLESKQDVILEYMYPRLDVEVSKHLNHLLKSPFCVHPGTGRVCVPIDSSRPEEFNPADVPTVSQLLGEIDLWNKENPGAGAVDGEKVDDCDKTSLKPYVDFFKNFVAGLLRDEGAIKRERNEGAGDAMEF
ncbi:uncharacterized protein H6S33_001578 [Morchella sextelata]|uniref:uncharacterized protein n=1 Tax=Morchella sextelata TaxID=1174677 RepID=UPI001D053BA4|nr:uncharacterized protein H6S33_001578 [Morchella sextelata]KAH0608444.1 hypothetical protein H6S33_001578 [Morchella sextelata]